jgi:hypothetical protein
MLALMRFYGPTYARGARWKIEDNKLRTRWTTYKNQDSLKREVELVMSEYSKMVNEQLEVVDVMDLHPLMEDTILVVLRELK